MEITIMVDICANELEVFAAHELKRYLSMLFALEVPVTSGKAHSDSVVFCMGCNKSEIFTKNGWKSHLPDTMSEQDIYLRSIKLEGRQVMLVSGGSSKAVMWAVYELVEKWGVKYLLYEDIIPDKTDFYLPDIDVLMEPELKIRQWRVVNEFACGPVSWGIAEYRNIINQLAKMKFNSILISTWPHQPFVHYVIKGIERKTANFFWGYRFPVSDDMIGRHLFGDVDEFWNPDLPENGDYREFVEAGQRLIHSIIEYAHARGMECVLAMSIFDFPEEFSPLLSSSRRVRQLGELTCVPGEDVKLDDPSFIELTSEILKQTINTYPEVDRIFLGMPEFRQWKEGYEDTWKILDRKYGIEQKCPLHKILEDVLNRPGYSGGSERALDEVKGDIVMLYFYNRLFTELGILKDTARPDMKIMFGNISEELFPIAPLVFPGESHMLLQIDYTANRILKRKEVLKNVPAGEMSCIMIYTLHDDNVGIVPMNNAKILQKLTEEVISNGISGYSTRYWMTSDHDLCVAYIAKAAWERNISVDSIYEEYIGQIYGKACIPGLVEMHDLVERTTSLLEWKAESLSFPIPDMIMKYWKPEGFPLYLVEAQENYVRALEAVKRIEGLVKDTGIKYYNYWVKRLEFGISYLDTIEAVCSAGLAESQGDTVKAGNWAQKAMDSITKALEAFSEVAGNRSDIGAIAVMNEFVYRAIKRKMHVC